MNVYNGGAAVEGVKVYAFDGETYTGENGTTDAAGEVVFTLPEGDYRFRADYDGVQFWSNTSDHCAVPGCTEAGVAIPGGLGHEEITIDYTYDPLNRLTAADYSDETFFHYQYDAVGNRLQLDSSQDGLVAYQYDAANHLIEAGGVSYTWDANGNLLSDGTSTYTYNYANRLSSVTQDGVTYTYAYNGMGDRLQQSVDGVATNYTLDINAGLTQVLADGTSSYLYGRGRITQISAGVPEYFLGDALGSVRQVADPAAEAVLTQSYQPYGEVLNQYGDAATPYGFTGEWTDGTGLVHLRARYYSPGQARFISKDAWDGKFNVPGTLNKYNYGLSNPFRYADPSGNVVCLYGRDPVTGECNPPPPWMENLPPFLLLFMKPSSLAVTPEQFFKALFGICAYYAIAQVAPEIDTLPDIDIDDLFEDFSEPWEELDPELDLEPLPFPYPYIPFGDPKVDDKNESGCSPEKFAMWWFGHPAVKESRKPGEPSYWYEQRAARGNGMWGFYSREIDGQIVADGIEPSRCLFVEAKHSGEGRPQYRPNPPFWIINPEAIDELIRYHNVIKFNYGNPQIQPRGLVIRTNTSEAVPLFESLLAQAGFVISVDGFVEVRK